ncbi:MAG: FAD-dependent oxidoreductase, partial [Bdellovibrionales bacterium]|nr:FAD-dependent oxidoreductase [Bdellovibrionales bacterium]
MITESTHGIPVTRHPRVVIVGGGFGGISVAAGLVGSPFQVVLLDRSNFHTFQPLLYQVATAGLEPDSIAFPLRKLFAHRHGILFRMAEVHRVDPARKVLLTSIGGISYDHLVIATGSTTNTFGMADIERHCFPLKSVRDALELRSAVLECFEEALLTQELAARDALMTFVVVGGGPTG